MEIKIPTAKEMADGVEANIKAQQDATRNRAIKAIEAAFEKAKETVFIKKSTIISQVTLDVFIPDDVKGQLNNMGYGVKNVSEANATSPTFVISWKK